MKIYCINLERSQDRRHKMQSQFERLSLPFEFIKAVDGRSLSYRQIAKVYSKWRTRLSWGSDLSRGEIGCALSHIDFYRRVVENNAPGFVFEDDVELTADVECALEKVSSFLSAAKSPSLVQLPGLERDLPRCKEDCLAGAFVKVSSAIGAYAYGVNPATAALLLKVFTPIKFPIDRYGYLIKQYGLEFYVYNSKVITVDMVSESMVGDDRFKTYKGAAWLCYKVWRLIGKMVDSIMVVLERLRDHK